MNAIFSRRAACWGLAAALLLTIAPTVPALAQRSRPAATSRGRKGGADRQAVLAVARQYVSRQTGMPAGGLRVRVAALRSAFARVLVAPADGSTDQATVYLRKAGGRWKVIAGPGTHFERRELDRLGIPKSVR